MEPDEVHARASAQAGQCDGSCHTHHGEVTPVTVRGWGHFSYCEAAVEEDKARGLIVDELQEGGQHGTHT